jgi:hypothetical protein
MPNYESDGVYYCDVVETVVKYVWFFYGLS